MCAALPEAVAMDCDLKPIDRSLPIHRLKRIIHDLLDAYSAAEYLGSDQRLAELALSFGLGPDDITTARALIGRRIVTIVGILTEIWTCSTSHDALFRLREAARFMGVRLFFVPELAARRRPRLETARVIAESAGVPITADDRLTVLQHLVENGRSTLHDCACVISNPAPYAAVLAMASLGVVDIDLDQRLTPDTEVRLPVRRAA